MTAIDNEIIPPGLYKHFKGNTYRVLGVVFDADTNEKKVLYQSVWDTTWYSRSVMRMKVITDRGEIIERFVRVGD